MKLIPYVIRLLLFTVLLCCLTSATAKVEPWRVSSTQTLGRAFKKNDTINVYPANTYLNSAVSIYRIRNYVSLHINNNTNLCLPDSFQCKVGIKISRWNKDSVPLSDKDTTLMVSYDKRSGKFYTQDNRWYMEDMYRLEVIIDSVSCDSNIARLLILEAAMEVEYYYTMTTGLLYTSPSGSADSLDNDSSYLIRASWTGLDFSEEYDLEWVYVDDYTTTEGNYILPYSEPDFRNNASRVTVKSTHYDFHPIFEHGYVSFRVRATGKSGTDYLHRANCNWSSTFYFKVNAIHEPKKNWQYVCTFAEEGKKKEVVSYMDGSLHNRQSVTQDNEQNMSIVGETIYDSEGRAGINILPVPAFNNSLKYFNDFNLNTATTPVPYSKSDFENLNSTTCHLDTPGQLSPTYGAGKYYSSSNPLASVAGNIHGYVPDAGGFPFVQVEYTHDNTGRISRQSGVGANHTLASGHDTKYIYETPDNEELIRLFGTNVGDISHYKKNTVIDANNQASISYLNASGKVIATALAGPSPDNLSALSSNTSSVELTKNLLTTQEIDQNSSRASYTFTVLENGQSYKLYYRVSTPKFNACLPSGNCFKGMYDLSISIEKNDECNQELFPTWPLVRKIDQDGEILDTLCASGTQLYSFKGDNLIYDTLDYVFVNDSFLLLTLSVGTYTISRSIQVNSDAAQRYAEMYMSQSTCIKKLSDFEEEYLDKLDSSLCFPTCVSCLAKVGTYAAFLENWITSLDTSVVKRSAKDTTNAEYYYAQHIKECEGLCDTISSPCENYLRTMIMDVSPSGQYFKLKEVDNQLYYDDTETLNIGRTFATASVGLNDEMVMVRGELKRYDRLTPKEFLDHFDPAWAKKLVVLHPEYCKYKQCALQNDTSSFISDFTIEENFDSALAKGYFNPINLSAFKPTFPASAIIDPLFIRDSHIDSMMTDSLTSSLFKLVNYNTTPAGVPLYKYIFTPTLSGLTYEPSDSTLHATYNITDSLTSRFNVTGKCRQNNQQVWVLFKYYYLRYRKNILDKWLKDSCAVTIPSGKRPLFKDFQNIKDTLSDAGIKSANGLSDNLQAMAEKQCKAYAWTWMTKLAGCNLHGGDSSRLADSLVAVCKRGTDERNPMGATSVSSYWKKQSTPANKNFHDVIANYYLSIYNRKICDEVLIDFPGDYNHDYYANYDSSWSPLDYPDSAATGFRYDNCTCNLLTALKATFDTDTSLCTSHGFAYYVNKKYSWNFTDSQLIILMLSCQASKSPGDNCTWTEVRTKSHTDGNKYYDSVALTIKIPMTLRCVNVKQCLNYSQVAAAAEAFVKNYGNPDTSWILADLLGKYLNHRFGYNLAYDDYIDFINQYDTVFYKNYGYTLKDTTTYHTRPVFQDMFVNVDKKCNCNKLKQGWAIWTSMTPRPTDTYQEYVAQVLGYSIPYEPNEYTIDSLVNHCLGMSDTTSLKCFKGFLCVLEANQDPCENMPESHLIDDCKDCEELCQYYICASDSVWVIDYCLLDSLLDKADKACTVLTPCEIITNEHAYDSVVADTAQMLLKADYGHDFYVFDSKVYLENDSTTMRIICNEPTKDAQDFFELLNFMIHYDTFEVNQYINVSKTPIWNSSTLKYRYNDTCFTCAQQTLDPPIVSDNPNFIYVTHSNSVSTHKHKFTIFLGADTITGCKVVFDSINVSTLDSIQGFYHLRPLGPLRVDSGQRFALKAKLLDNSVITLTGISYCIPIAECCPPNLRGRLCNEPFFPTIATDTIDCLTEQIALLKAKAYNAYLEYADSVKTVFENHYTDSCMAHLINHERFILRYPLRQHHYTLYYYDQAGNLTQTVPPNGVAMLNSGDVQNVINNSSNPAYVLEPTHSFRTNYQYNSLNQVIWQQTPDGGESNFWYDQLGRVILSQNAKQAVMLDSTYAYSYTLYDAQGRISEVGELKQPAVAAWNGLPLPYSSHVTDVMLATRSQITQTTYDVIPTPAPIPGGSFTQHYLRGRVSAVTFRRAFANDVRHATYYDYDLHGNVQSLLQYNQSLEDLGMEYKQIDYAYDLVSGKVNTVTYQDNEADAFYHHYEYDAENRLTQVNTSRDSIIWDQDAAYNYYLHGPLARTEIQPLRHLQGLDYVYTIQGWIKSVNSNQLKGIRDPGKDGVPAGTSSWANDVMGYSLSYFEGDYKTINTGITAVSSPVGRTSNSVLAPATHNLFNGNIRSMVTSISKFMTAANKPQGMAYKYDQLNRITEANAFDNFDTTNNKWDSTGTAMTAYKNKFTYDANGNILTQVRRGAGAIIPMDSLTYHYSGTDNKLQYVDDAISTTNYAEDIDDQSSGNYDYDAIGNLIKDNQEQIAEIKWTVYGKISDIIRTSTSYKPDLAFEYGPDGNRVMKIVKPKSNHEPWIYTYYVRDASGNVMAVYGRHSDKKIQYDQLTFTQINDSIVNDTGATLWRDFMNTTAGINTSGFKNAYIQNLIDNSLGSDFLQKFNITDTWVDIDPADFGDVIDNQYNFAEVLDNMLSCGLASGMIDAVCAYNSGQFIEACISTDMYNYLNEFNNYDNVGFDAMYTAIGSGTATTLADKITELMTFPASVIASYIDSNGGCSLNSSIMLLVGASTTSLAIRNYNTTVGSSIIEGEVRNYISTYGDYRAIADCFEAYDKAAMADKIFAEIPVGGSFDWVSFFNTQTNYFTIMLTNYPTWASYTQDERNDYSMNQYFDWIGDYFGLSYYTRLKDRFYQETKRFTEKYELAELDIYGSSRLGMMAQNFLIKGKSFVADYSFITGEFSNIDSVTDTACMVHYNYKTLVRGYKQYELSNHLGNVLAVISDKRITLCSDSVVSGYEADVISASDYYPFGMVMQERSFASADYKYGYNGKEKVNEINVEGGDYDFGARIYDGRLGRWLSLDPCFKDFPMMSPYCAMGNNPIMFIDVFGAYIIIPNPSDREAVLRMINSKALGMYAINETTGILSQVSAVGDATRYSTYYRDKLVLAINDPEEISIIISTTFVYRGEIKNVDDGAYGGGVTVPYFYISDNPNERGDIAKAEITISGNAHNVPTTTGGTYSDRGADILQHELVGHAIPMTTIPDTGNAVENDNKARAETQTPIRASEPNHLEIEE